MNVDLLWRSSVSRASISVGVLGLVTIAAYGVAYYAYGVLIDPIRAHTHWSAPALGAIFSAVLVIGGAGGLAGGRLVDRVGTRPAFLLAGTVGAGAMIAASYEHQLGSFALFYAGGCGVVSALGFYQVTQPAAIRAATGGPERAVVLVTIFGAFASPIFLPLTAALIDGIGWRGAIRVLAVVVAATFLLAALVPATTTHTAADRPQSDRVSSALVAAWRTPGVPRWIVASLISGAAVDVILLYQVPVMVAAGLPIGLAATIGGLRGLAQLGGRIPLARVLRVFGARRTIVASLLAGGLGASLLLAGGHLVPALMYGLLAGAAIGAIYALQGIYTNELVGQPNLGLLMGAQQAVFAIGGALGPIFGGVLFATTGSYVPIVLLGSAALIVSSAIMSRSDSPPSHAASEQP